MSLSRGPALILGTVMLVAGLYFLYRGHTFPRLSQFPSGHAATDHHAFFGIFGINGWTGELTAVAGGVLMFGAAQHLLAKTASLIVGVVLAVVAVWALTDHNSAMGLFATNIWTIIGWGGAAVLLLINTLMPRRQAVETTTESSAAATTAVPVATRPAATPVLIDGAAPVAAEEPTVIDPAADARPVAGGPLRRVRYRGAARTSGASRTGERPIRRQPSTGTDVDDSAATGASAGTETRSSWASRITGHRDRSNSDSVD